MHDSLVRGTVVTSTEVIPDGWIAITGERIAAVGEGHAPQAATVLDYSGKLVLPGLVDGHMHTSSAIGYPASRARPARLRPGASRPAWTCPTTCRRR